ncbi:gamma-mobile-trio recombinase GmtY [Endozoicomonas gorgoniicola]|uniref:Gamma-mobile-trio recombinase GmtY n=1 Tax=Endozoicomonas gorgoniicola TaxID=1234144 RepID=A0ABT3MP01_9GAMM|nr:gamma-mobile-trio recombinase GmtY [Endozoicomonas gorgoniicola]MCW7551105.1 gamma-mobile-trio recombinase GmtY [Endozoicomonas gorgoniicola]MCW7556010.1 gamma-mobile-trio recombinase GmtY [Endozoicomonas gorgoniicola]
MKTRARVVTDNTGFELELPVLVSKDGVLEPLLDYLLVNQHNRSNSWCERVVHGAYLLMQYIEANQSCFSSPKSLFESFVRHLYSGTIDNDGYDPSGLYWLPASTQTVNGLINSLTGLTDYLADNIENLKSMNPNRMASRFEERLNYAAWYRRNQEDFLGHIKDKSISSTSLRARNIMGKRLLVVSSHTATQFPENIFKDFFVNGIGANKDPRSAIRNQLILLMLHFTGCRESEALHLWINDVLIDPLNSESVSIRIYHPEEGKAPDNWVGSQGQTHRAAYLRERYLITPRNKILGTKKVGWKCRVMDHSDKYIQLYWFPTKAGVLFNKLWRMYIKYLAVTDRLHPYAFVSFSKKNIGAALTLNAFNDAYKRGLIRIGKAPSKEAGLTPHSHRHSMGRRLERAGVHPRIIQKVLHHVSIESQDIYTAPSLEDISQSLNKANSIIESEGIDNTTNQRQSDWDELMKVYAD